MFDSIEILYVPDNRDRAIFGERYAPPEKFEHGQWYPVAFFPKVGADGQPVEIDECRWPARFFRLRALASPNSVGEEKPAFALSTGSGDEAGKLLVQMAYAIAGGMLTLAQKEPGGPDGRLDGTTATGRASDSQQ